MEDKNDILLKQLFEQAAQQQIEDNGFTERVMMNLPETSQERVRRLSRLWTLFCGAVGIMLFFVLGGWQIAQGLFYGGLRMMLGWLEVFMVTAPTTEFSVNPWVVVLVLAFVLVFLPYQIARKLYVIQ